MTTSLRTRAAQFAAIALALFAGSAVAAALPHDQDHARVVVVGPRASAQALVRAEAATGRAGAEMRVARTTADELGVTHMLAARGYDTIVTVGVDERIAVAPVAERYPDVRFVAAPRDLQRALR